jgi:deoxyhypusine synthase
MNNSAPEIAMNAVLKGSEKMPEGSETVKGYDFNNGLDYGALLATYKLSGFQATNFGKAVDEINNMVDMSICHPKRE